LESLRALASDVLKDIAKGVLQRGVVNPAADFAQSVIGSIASSAAGSFFGSSTTAAVAHTGGTVGYSTNFTRQVPSSRLSPAPRLHNGLRSDEFPAILQRGEQVIPKGQRMESSSPTINIYAQDAGSIVRNRGQSSANVFSELQRYKRRNR